MPLLFFLAGLILVVTGVNGTLFALGALLKNDFTGPNNFFGWFFAILIAGALGYIPTLKPVSFAFLALVFVAILLSSGSGFFAKFNSAMRQLTSTGISPNVGGGGGSNDPLEAVFGTDFGISNHDAIEGAKVVARILIGA